MIKDFKITADPDFIVIDLFCGAGGTTQGFEDAFYVGPDGMLHRSALVVACVNHDWKAIKSHWINHPWVEHFNEDITKLYGYIKNGVWFKSAEMLRLMRMVDLYRAIYPDAKVILWASLECTNFSKAKGGLPRNADSRTLADHLQYYIDALQPDIIQIENVVEFMSWGPLDKNGKPVSKKNGSDWMRWRSEICSLGYVDEWRQLNSADFGAYTSRNRLFGMFARERSMITWPEPTHCKKPSTSSMFEKQEKWKAVKEVLDFSDEGESIFNRKKPLSDKTLERIYAGLLKYVAKGDTSFISKYFSGRPAGKVNSVNDPSSTITTFGNSTIVQTKNFADLSVDQPAGTVTCVDHHALVQTSAFIAQRNNGEPMSKIVDINGPARTLTATAGNPEFLLKYNSTDKNGRHHPPSINDPCPVVATQNRLGLIQPQFLIHYYGSGGEHSSIDAPAPTIPTRDRSAVVRPQHFLEKSYGGYRNNQSIDQPAGSVMPNDKHRLIKAEPLIEPNQQVQVNCNCGNERIRSEDKYLTEPCPDCGGFSGHVTYLYPDQQPFLMPTSYDNKPRSIEDPAPTLQASRRHHYLVNPSWGGNPGSIDQPSPVIIARQDKAPLYLVQVEHGFVHVAVYPEDTEIAIRIKEFMAAYQLVDIKMRMLRVKELLNIQGFPADYKLEGNQTDQKKFIGNSVVPLVVKCWTQAISNNLKIAA